VAGSSDAAYEMWPMRDAAIPTGTPTWGSLPSKSGPVTGGVKFTTRIAGQFRCSKP
jgi:hypothetical protein